MKDFINLLYRLIPPYKKSLISSILNNFLSIFFGLFSFALIIPILEILFGQLEGVYTTIKPLSGVPADQLAEVVKNNFYCYILNFKGAFGGGNTLLTIGALLVLMTFFKSLFMFMGSSNMITIRTGVVRDLRTSIYDKIIRLPLSFYSEEKKGDIMARMSGDVIEVENSVMSSIDMLFKNVATIFFSFLVMLIISWQLTVFVLLVSPVALIVMGRISKKLKKPSREGQNQLGELFSQIEETLTGLRVIMAFNAEDKIKKRFSKQNENIRRTFSKVGRRQVLAHPVSEFLSTVIVAIVIWFGGSLILKNESVISASTFIYYLLIFANIISPAKSLSQAWYTIEKGMASMERIDKILKTESTVKEPEKPVHISSFNNQIRFNNVCFRYDSEPVLKNINMVIPKGKTIALVGLSGSGKSTLVDLIPRFYDVESGSITIDETDIRDIPFHELRSLMGNVNQEAILFNDTFFNNISFGVENATMDQVIEAAKIANAHDFIIATENGYESNIGDRGGKLSGGQRQRISIARAILKNPPILILDEATSALDTESERLVQEALENLMKNRTTIVIAHRLSTIKNADMIYVINDGELVESGNNEQLLDKKGVFRRLYDMQSF